MSDLSEIRLLLAAMPPELRQNVLETAERGLNTLRKPEDISLAVWAHRHFYLSAESSQREERWRAWWFQLGILECMGSDLIEEFAFRKSARLGYTKCLLADIAYTAQHQRRNQGIWQPTDADSDDFTKTELEPMLRDVAIMRTVFPRVLQKSKANTLQQKKFIGSLLKMRGGKAAGNYRRLTLAKARADEIDGFDQQIEGSGDPATLIKKRVEGATYPKCIFGGTPRVKGLSHVDKRYAAADIRLRYFITCPHCNADHPLEWGGPDKPYGIKWDVEDPENTARHHCQHCHRPITHADYLRIGPAGYWASECGNYRLNHGWHPNGEPWTQWTTADGTACLPPKRVAMHCWTAYSPVVTWGQIVREFLEAHKVLKAGDRGPMVQWVNETKGESYEEEGETADANALQTRARQGGIAMRRVPHGGLLLVAGIDVQDNRFEIVVWAVGRGEEMWAIDYIVMDANPADMRDWDALYTRLREQYQHMNGPWLGLSGAAIDTGGHYTHQAYAFVAKYQDRDRSFRLYAIKGSSTEGDPIKAKGAKWVDINIHGRIIKKGVRLWFVGGDTARDLFYGRLKVTQPGPGYIHFAAELPSAFFKQYSNEKRMQVRTQTRTFWKWVHTTGANEVPDCTMYAIFTMHALDVAGFSERRWRELEAQTAPDLFDMANESALPLPMPALAQPEPSANTLTNASAAAPAPEPAPPLAKTRPPEQRPRPAAQTKKTTAHLAHNPFASEEWMARG